MAVVTDFIGVPVVGIPPSFPVQFTDLSTGGPDNWWWDFGDGYFSTEQHPLHTYDGTVGQVFTVKLKSFKSGSTINHGTIDKYKHKQKTSSTFGSTAEAYADLMDTPFQEFPSVAELKAYYFSDGTGTDEEDPLYNAAIVQPTANLVLPAPGGAGPSNFRLNFASTQVSLYEGTISMGGSYISGEPNQFMDVTGMGGDITFVPATPFISIIPPQAPFQRAGVGCTAALEERTTAAEDDTDTEVKVNYISFGIPPVADFTADPVFGVGPLSVQFQNLSTPAIGLPTNYSWKKRISGSGDAFVEFSTAENPLHIFSKS